MPANDKVHILFKHNYFIVPAIVIEIGKLWFKENNFSTEVPPIHFPAIK